MRENLGIYRTPEKNDVFDRMRIRMCTTVRLIPSSLKQGNNEMGITMSLLFLLG